MNKIELFIICIPTPSIFNLVIKANATDPLIIPAKVMIASSYLFNRHLSSPLNFLNINEGIEMLITLAIIVIRS